MKGEEVSFIVNGCPQIRKLIFLGSYWFKVTAVASGIILSDPTLDAYSFELEVQFIYTGKRIINSNKKTKLTNMDFDLES